MRYTFALQLNRVFWSLDIDFILEMWYCLLAFPLCHLFVVVFIFFFSLDWCVCVWREFVFPLCRCDGCALVRRSLVQFTKYHWNEPRYETKREHAQIPVKHINTRTSWPGHRAIFGSLLIFCCCLSPSCVDTKLNVYRTLCGAHTTKRNESVYIGRRRMVFGGVSIISSINFSFQDCDCWRHLIDSKLSSLHL